MCEKCGIIFFAFAGDRTWRDVRVVEGARLESVYVRKCIGGSNPPLTAIQIFSFLNLKSSFKLIYFEI